MNILICIKNFKHVVDYKGISKASRKIYVSPATLSKQITYLEEWLDVKLLKRTSRVVELTAMGNLFYTRASKILDEVESLHQFRQSISDKPHGVIRISMPPSFGRIKLLPLLVKYMMQYIEVDLDIETATHAMAFRERVDVAVTNSKVQLPGVSSIVLKRSKRYVFASPSYLKQFGVPKLLGDLEHHSCLINLQLPSPNIWQFGDEKIVVKGRFVGDRFMYLLDCAKAGLGLILAREDEVEHSLKEGSLIQVLGDQASIDVSYYVNYRPHLLSPTIENFIEFLQSEFSS